MQVVSFINPSPAPHHNQTPPLYQHQIEQESLIGVSTWTEYARKLVRTHASHNRTVILEGERGTGKKLLARLIHRHAAHPDGPFVSLALGSTSDDVASTTLFGSQPEGTDNAEGGEKGLVELAQGGTLYIEGFPEISPSLTDEILELAESRSYNRHAERPVRILLGWNVRSGSCHRTPCNRSAGELGFERIQVPSLRERTNDIEALAEHFIHQRCRNLGKELRRLTPQALESLCSYDWPRNVSELRTLISQLVAHATPPAIDVSLLPGYMLKPVVQSLIPPAGIDLDAEVRRVEVDFICAALKQCHGLQNKAAQLLHIKPTTLFMKIRRHGIDVEAFR